MVDPSKLKILLPLTISTPIKPGAVHRLVEAPIFEKRLAEALVIAELVGEAYNRGREVASGRRAAQTLGLGSLIGQAYRRILEVADVKPIAGLAAASLSMASVAGYLSVVGKGLRDGLRQAILTLLYKSGGRDASEFLEGLEAVGDSEAVNTLEREGYTRRAILLEDVPLGDLFEKLSSYDYGFLVNIRGYSRIVAVASRASKAKSLAGVVLSSYLALLEERGVKIEPPLTVRKLAAADKELRGRGGFDGLLGAVYAAASIVVDERPDIPVA